MGNDYGNGEDCVEMHFHNSIIGKWNDDQCNKLQPSICEKVELGTCVCAEGCYGDDCSQFTCPNDCSGMGTCDSTTGLCICYAGCSGDDCSQFTYLPCPGDGTCS